MCTHPRKAPDRRLRPWRGLLLSGLVALLALPLASPIHAEEEEQLPEATAGREVRRLIAAGETSGLAEIARRRQPDPWLIADWLLLHGDADAAEALAKAGFGPDTSKLGAYVAARRGKNDEAQARAALSQARKRIEAQKFAEAYPLLEGVKVTEATVVSVQVLYARGMSAYVQRRLDTAMADLQAARAQARRLGWLNLESNLLQWSVQTSMERGSLTTAAALARARVALEERRARPEVRADALLRLADVLRKTRDFAGGLAALGPALEIYRAAEDDAQIAKTLHVMSAIADDADDPLTAIDHAREALTLYERLKDAAGLTDVLISLGTYYETVGNYGRSKTYLQRGLAMARQHGFLGLRVGALSHLGLTHADLGEYPAALNCYEEAIALARAGTGAHHLPALLNNLAVLQEGIGNLAAARKALRETLALFEAQENPRGIAKACLNLGVIARFAGDVDESDVLLQRALKLDRAGRRRRDIASDLAAMAANAAFRGRDEKAAGLHQESLAIYEELHARAEMAFAQSNLARVLLRLDQPDEAFALLEQATEQANALRSPKISLQILASLAWAHLQAGAWDRALQVAESALPVMEVLVGGLAESEGAATRARHSSIFEIGAVAALRSGATAKVLHFLESGRAGSLLESLGGRDALRWADLPAELREAETTARLEEARAATRWRTVMDDPRLETQRAAEQALQAATERVREVIVKIQRTAKAQAGLFYPRPAPSAEIQRRLGPKQALVVYGFCGGIVLAAVLRPHDVRVVEVGSSIQVREACQALGRPDAGTGTAFARLRALLVEPLQLAAGVEQVLISPAGALCYVPFSAIFDQVVSLTPSGTTHALLSEEQRLRGKRVLAIGDPAYQGAGDPVYTRGGRLTRLPGTRAEVNKVGDDVLVGDEASESELRKALAKGRHWRAIHIACHGRIDRERPTLCALALTPGDEEDGFLTALEVLRMRIPSDLAVLSACETGSGQIVKGEGIVGLVRAFMYAGSPRVIASLWKVDDAATQALMVKFYELWSPQGAAKKGGLGAAAALKQAQEHVRKQKGWEHPYYWAAWVLWGLPE